MAQNKRPKAPNVNDSSLTRESWKIFQVIAEFVDGYERLFPTRPSVSLFGSARVTEDHPYYQLAFDTAYTLSEAGFSVTTGGGPGLMEAANRGAYQGKSFSIGLNIELLQQEPPNDFQDISLRFRHFFTRKIMFVKYACAYVVLPGGFGTLDEFAEILTLLQTQKTKRIPVVLVNAAFWNDLLAWFRDRLLAEGMINASDFDLFQVVETPEEALKAIQDHYKALGKQPGEDESSFRDL